MALSGSSVEREGSENLHRNLLITLDYSEPNNNFCKNTLYIISIYISYISLLWNRWRALVNSVLNLWVP
jgi:hypothetical protein